MFVTCLGFVGGNDVRVRKLPYIRWNRQQSEQAFDSSLGVVGAERAVAG